MPVWKSIYHTLFGLVKKCQRWQLQLISSHADILLCIGTSLQVYPAASLVFLAPDEARRIVIDPHIPESIVRTAFECIAKPASVGVPGIVRELLQDACSNLNDTKDK